APIVSGIYKPTNIGQDDTFFAPAPGGPYGTALSVFAGTDPNGAWLLYIVDDSGTDAGLLAGGWRLSFNGTSSVLLAGELAGGNMVLSWPGSLTGYVLESGADLSGPWVA